MSNISIAIITPTISRMSLRRTLESGINQLERNDEWFVIGDGEQPLAKSLVESLDHNQITYEEHYDLSSSYGNAQRNYAMKKAKADFFFFLDDDDILLPGGLQAIRKHGENLLPMVFCMDYGPARRPLWYDQKIRPGNLGGSMLVLPNIEGKYIEWPLGDAGTATDFRFISGCTALWGESSIVWCKEVICRCEDHGKGIKDIMRIGEGSDIHESANVYNSIIGKNTKVAAFVEIGGSCIGSNCKIQASAFIPPGVTIEDEVFIGPHVCFTNDKYPSAVGDWKLLQTVVKRGASIGANATILPGITIGENALIGAGATVLHDVPANSTYT